MVICELIKFFLIRFQLCRTMVRLVRVKTRFRGGWNLNPEMIDMLKFWNLLFLHLNLFLSNYSQSKSSVSFVKKKNKKLKTPINIQIFGSFPYNGHQFLSQLHHFIEYIAGIKRVEKKTIYIQGFSRGEIFKYNQQKITEYMNILLNMRKQSFRNENLSSFLQNYHGMQLVCLVLLPILDPLSMKVAEFFLIFLNHSGKYNPLTITVNFVFSATVLLLILLTIGLEKRKISNQLGKIVSLIIGSFKYILLVPMLSMNITFVAQENPKYLTIFAVINIIFAVCIGFFDLYSNWSNRFQQKDFCHRRENSFFVYLLLIALITIQTFLGSFIGAIFLLIYSIFSFYQITTYIEFSFIQKNIAFYCFFNVFACIIIFTLGVDEQQPLRIQTLAYSLIFGWAIIKYGSEKIVRFLDYRQSNVRNIFSFKLSMDDNDRNLGGESGEKNKNGKNDLFILAKIFFSRKNSGMLFKKEEDNNKELRFWCKQYNEVLLFHLATCSLTDCVCRQKIGDWEHQIIISEMNAVLAKNLKQNQKGVSLKVTAIYLFVEIAQKPLKAYYEIMRLKREKNTVVDSIDLQCLIEETRECFDQIFLKNNVQNNSLTLLKVIEFQDIIQSLEQKIRNTIEMNINFLELFTLNSVKVLQVLSESAKIFANKASISRTLQYLIMEYPDNQRVQMIIFVFYQFLEVYRSREKEFKIFNQEKMIKKRIFDKANDDIFKPEYGVIYIDLIEERGKIQKVTKNLCKVFGYNIEDMISFNINQFMPRLYGKHHAKFLANFIDNGAIKILKEKRRFLFGKNKSKFIFPVLARLKTQHLFNREFGASGLIKGVQTNSGYIIIGVNGKIEEISQNVYERIFSNVLKTEVDKVRRFCIYKFIPEFVKIISNIDFDLYNQRVHESIAIFSQDPATLFEKFRIFRQSKKNGSSSGCPQTSRSMSYSDSQYSTTTGVQNKTFDWNQEFCAETFKNFLMDLNFLKLVFLRISFKVSKLKTNEFELVLIEIVNFGDVQQDVKEMIQIYKYIANFLGIYDDQSPLDTNFSKYTDLIDKNDFVAYSIESKSKQSLHKIQDGEKKKGRKTLKLIKGQNELDQTSSIIRDDFSQSVHMFNQGQNNLNQHMRGTSERSSVTDSTQNQSKKQMLINAFNLSSMEISIHMGCCLAFAGVKAILLIVLIICTVSGIQDMKDYTVSQNLTMNISQIYQYRLSLSEIDEFYATRISQGITIDPNVVQKLHNSQNALTTLFTDKIQNMDDENYGVNYISLNVTMLDTITNLQESINLISLLNRLEFTFQHEADPNSLLDLRVNYQSIHTRFKKLFEENHEIYRKSINKYKTAELVFFVVYEVIVVGISIMALFAYSHYRKKEKKIIDLLRTMNTRQIKKAKLRLKILWDNFKLAKLSNLSNAISNLNHEVDTLVDNEPEQSHGRNIKLIYEGNKQKIGGSLLVILILAFIVAFSGVSIVLYSSFISNLSLYVQATDILKDSYALQQKVPLFLNLYLSNINNILGAREIREFDPKMYTEAQIDFFNLTEYISKKSEHSTSLNGIEDKGIWDDICDIIVCQPSDTEQDLKLSYHVLDLKNKFHILSPDQNGISQITAPEIENWAEQNDIDRSLQWVYVLFRFSQKWNKVLVEESLQAIRNSQIHVVIVSAVILPLYAIIMAFISYKMVQKLNRIITNAEHIHMHFPVSVLSENTYLTSYFNDKIKNNK